MPAAAEFVVAVAPRLQANDRVRFVSPGGAPERKDVMRGAEILASLGLTVEYRIASRLDVAAARRDPKPLVGVSDITSLHLVLWQRCRLVGFHGPRAGWSDEWYGSEAAEALRRALMQPESVTVHQDPVLHDR